MIEPKDLGYKDLKDMHKMAREKHQHANSALIKTEAGIILNMLDA